jgi:enoyl-CoA hydratase/carnithine racemase
VLDEALDYARRLAESVAPNSLMQTRWQVYRDLHRDVASAVRDSEQLLDSMMREPDYAEGVAAFLEKRTPVWGSEPPEKS